MFYIVYSLHFLIKSNTLEFRKFIRKQVAELRAIEDYEIKLFKIDGKLKPYLDVEVSISQEDLKNGSPRLGDMVARNPKNYLDQWLVSEQYFNDNFKEY